MNVKTYSGMDIDIPVVQDWNSIKIGDLLCELHGDMIINRYEVSAIGKDYFLGINLWKEEKQLRKQSKWGII